MPCLAARSAAVMPSARWRTSQRASTSARAAPSCRSRTAKWSAVMPSHFLLAFTSALAPTSFMIIAWSPVHATPMRGEEPDPSLVLGRLASAPLDRRASTTPWCSSSMASCRGVARPASCASGQALASSSATTLSRWPASAQWCSGVDLSDPWLWLWLVPWTPGSARASRRGRTAALQVRTARWRGLLPVNWSPALGQARIARRHCTPSSHSTSRARASAVRPFSSFWSTSAPGAPSRRARSLLTLKGPHFCLFVAEQVRRTS
mmetsp:Transcript_36242/g.102075  ORF Transcript_36242/g.102075 Transcript_36242/m.102075 type:complete len:263 (-) Transcript_36242:730-1518(-)